jgi:hypothetical protein
MLKLALIVLCLAASGACDRADDGTGLSQTGFVDVIADLRRASVSAPDPAAFAVRKEQILRDAGVTEDQLRAYITAHQRDLRHMAAVWESINVRLADPETM